MNAVIYARYSSHGQTEQSIEGQLRDNRAWAKQQGITVVGEYIDRALSGTKDQRPAFQRMIEDAAKRQFQLVIVWKLDRFARNRYDSAIYKARLKKYGVRVVSVKEAITDSPEGIILEGLLESMAEYYSANLAQNVRRGMRESIAKGNFVGGTVPYGYSVEGKKLVVNEKEAPMVRFMFEQYAQGVPKKQIIDELNRRGWRSRSGKPLSYNSFTHVLPNPVYVGRYTYMGSVVPGLAQPIIEEPLFEQVQQRLALMKRAPGTTRADDPYLLAGKLFCGQCGNPMVGESGKSHTGTKYHYYACRNKKKRRGCRKKNERKDWIEDYVVSHTVEYVLTPGRIETVAAAVAAEYQREFSGDRVSELEKAIRRIDRELDALVDVMIDTPKPQRPRIAEKMEALNAQREDVQADLARLRVASEIALSEEEVRDLLYELTRGDINDESYRHFIVDTFISSVYVYDDKLLIFYNIRGGKQVAFSEINLPDPPPTTENSSDVIADGVPEQTETNPRYVFIKGVFGCVFFRTRTRKERSRRMK